MKNLYGLILICFLWSCDTHRVFEDYRDFDDGYWAQDDRVSFSFEVVDAEIPYNLYANFRNASAYPYHNLYYQYSLMDSAGRLLENELQNINLFDPKTGQPLGSGLGDLFDHQQLILDNYTFTAPGTYQITFEQYMRRDTLPLLLSVGARVEWAETSE